MNTDDHGRPAYSSGWSQIDGQSGRTALRRDDQQWLLDYVIQHTGRAMHFQGDARGPLPRTVRSHAMISKHVAKQAMAAESLALTEEGQGHRESAMQFYYWAAGLFASAQHPIFRLNNEKRFLADGVRRCYDKVIEFAPYRIERVEVPWEDSSVVGHLHLNPNVRGPAPVVFYIPGCDVTKESWPNPFFNQAHQRGMHAFSFDGPGQGESILRGIKLTADNYEHAASAAVTALRERSEIDDDGVLVYATSFGSLWGMRLAAIDHTIRAMAAPQASICEKFIQTDLESPRWKQLFAFLTQAASEEELDTLMADMTMEGRMGDVVCPTLLTVGEFDPRAPLEPTLAMFDEITASAEMWVMADQHHWLTVGGGDGWNKGSHSVCLDWLRDRYSDRPLRHPGEVLWVDSPAGPNAAKPGRMWFKNAARDATNS